MIRQLAATHSDLFYCSCVITHTTITRINHQISPTANYLSHLTSQPRSQHLELNSTLIPLPNIGSWECKVLAYWLRSSRFIEVVTSQIFKFVGVASFGHCSQFKMLIVILFILMLIKVIFLPINPIAWIFWVKKSSLKNISLVSLDEKIKSGIT